MSLLPEIEFLMVDKRHFASEWARLRPQLAARRFDLLLHLHASFRANLLSTLVRAPIKLGFDRARARDLQWLFTNRRIQARRREHVLDSFWGFAEALGVFERRLEWKFPLPAEAVAYARRIIPDSQPTLLISPCSSHAMRNWRPEFYAQVADHAARRWNMRVVLCGGPTRIEREMGDRVINASASGPIDQIGRDTLPQMLALLSEATVLLDAGLGARAHGDGGRHTGHRSVRSRPIRPAAARISSQQWCVNRFPEAARMFMGREPEQLPWWVKIERPGVMDLIQPHDVIERLDQFMRR